MFDIFEPIHAVTWQMSGNTEAPFWHNELVMQGVACFHSALCASGSQQGSERSDTRMNIAALRSL